MGSYLILWLTDLEAQIGGYSSEPPTTPNLYSHISSSLDIKDILRNIRDHRKFEAALREFRPEIVFHLAAQPL